jgi:S1-C subfamily serine protease
VQTVEKFIPHLSSANEAAKSAALVAIAALGNEELAVKLARAFGGSGSTSALATIASSGGPSADAATKALSSLFEYLKARVVTIHDDPHRRASGFVASDTGLVVTTSHAIQGLPPDRLRIGLLDGRLVPARVLADDKQLDLALLATDTKQTLPAIQLSETAASLGSRVIALMVALDGSFVTTVGNVSTVDADMRIDFGDRRRLQHDRVVVRLAAEPGSSGVPVLDDAGRLVGIIQASDEKGTTILVPAATVSSFVAAHRGAA